MLEADHALDRLRNEWPQFQKIALDAWLCEIAGDMAAAFGLRAYDSVQLAAACEILSAAPGKVAFSCFDNRLNKAARVLGLDVT